MLGEAGEGADGLGAGAKERLGESKESEDWSGGSKYLDRWNQASSADWKLFFDLK